MVGKAVPVEMGAGGTSRIVRAVASGCSEKTPDPFSLLEVQPVDQARGPDATRAPELGLPACEINAAAPPLHRYHLADDLFRLDRGITGQ